MMPGGLFKRDPNFTLVKIYRERTKVSDIHPFPDLPERIRSPGEIAYNLCRSFHPTARRLFMQAGPEAADGRVVIAYPGNGASMTAGRHGKNVGTTMEFTPAGGLIMSTRSGDLDPGLLWYLARTEDIMSATRRQVLALTPLDKRSRPQPGAKTSPKEG
jgi:hypothetical protein